MLNFFLSASQILTEEGNWHKNYKNVSFSTNLSNLQNFNSWMIQLTNTQFFYTQKKIWVCRTWNFSIQWFLCQFLSSLKIRGCCLFHLLVKTHFNWVQKSFFDHFQYFLSTVEFFWTWSKVRLYLIALPSYLSIFEHNQKYWSLSKTFEHCQNIFELTNGIGMRETTKIKISSL